jgi:hypothetical protein
MTAPDDSENSRPISVAELLAKNGTIGSPPVGGRRRRRRGNSEAVTVAELTGEIPIVRTGEIPIAHDIEVTEEPAEEEAPVEPVHAPDTNGSAAATAAVDEDEQQDQPPARPFDGPPQRSDSPLPSREHGPERSHDPRPMRRPEPRPDTEAAASDAEHMAFDPVDESAPVLDLVSDDDVEEAAELQSYLRSSGGPLFSGQTVADDLARRGVAADDDEHDGGAVAVATEADHEQAEQPPRESKLTALWRALLVVGQSILAVAFGAGLFIAFDQLWRWNNIVALVLSVLVILGLVVAVRIVRKTEDIASTLIAVAVGALVTLGPLALLQST